jgi:hypothetical protein
MRDVCGVRRLAAAFRTEDTLENLLATRNADLRLTP